MAILTQFRHRFYNNDGTLLAGGKVYTYQAGTTTPKATYNSSTGLQANTNPIILDAKGEADIWTAGLYKINVLDANNVQVTGWPVDNIGQGQSSYDLAQYHKGRQTAGTFTVTLASPGVFTKVAHGLSAGNRVSFTTTGALPTGLAAATTYYVIATGLTADTFQVSATSGGVAINTSVSQSGVHSLTSDVEVLRLPMIRTVNFDIDMFGSRASARVAATASTTFNIARNGTNFATMVFAVGGTTATFVAATPPTFVATDILTVTSPVIPDATLEDIGFILAGNITA